MHTHPLYPIRSVVPVVTFLVLACTLPLRGDARDATGAWEPGVSVAPYGWLAGFDGTVGVPSDGLDGGGGQGLPPRLDVDPQGELREIGFMFYADWRGERWMAYFDSVWVNVSQSATVGLGILPGSDLEAAIDGNVYTGAVEYRLHDWQTTTLSAYAGARYYDVEAGVSASGGLLPQPAGVADSASWTDGVLGLRLAWRPGERWKVMALADAGFASSNDSRQAAVSVGYRFPWFSIIGGYRYLSIDYARDTLLMDISLRGPMVGLSARFR